MLESSQAYCKLEVERAHFSRALWVEPKFFLFKDFKLEPNSNFFENQARRAKGLFTASLILGPCLRARAQAQARSTSTVKLAGLAEIKARVVSVIGLIY